MCGVTLFSAPHVLRAPEPGAAQGPQVPEYIPYQVRGSLNFYHPDKLHNLPTLIALQNKLYFPDFT